MQSLYRLQRNGNKKINTLIRVFSLKGTSHCKRKHLSFYIGLSFQSFCRASRPWRSVSSIMRFAKRMMSAVNPPYVHFFLESPSTRVIRIQAASRLQSHGGPLVRPHLHLQSEGRVCSRPGSVKTLLHPINMDKLQDTSGLHMRVSGAGGWMYVILTFRI